MRLSDQDLRKLQLTQLGIAVEVTALCDAHQIPYVLLAGTALGARRHGGFIPWDDDMDLGLLRCDYDRLVGLAKAGGLPDRLHLQDWLDDPHMAAPYAKVRLNGTRMIEEWSQHTGGHKGIFIDIFPLDNMPDGGSEYRLHVLRLRYWIRLLHHQAGYTMNTQRGPLRLADLALRAIARTVPQARAKRRLQRLITRYDKRPTMRVAAVGGSYSLAKETLQRRWITQRTRCQFEDKSFFCSAASDEYLTHLYGDFMALPAEDQRHSKHGILELKFTDTAVPNASSARSAETP